MNSNLVQVLYEYYQPYNLLISDFILEKESSEYEACQYKLNDKRIHFRKAKITPKKAGQFVVFWKRKGRGPIEPYHEKDVFDFFAVNVQTTEVFGQFVFPKSVLIEKGIISTDMKEGKRAFRVYPLWDKPSSKQALLSQKWQLDYFIQFDDFTDPKKISELYK